MLKKSLSPDSVYVAGDFFTDGVDLLERFKPYFENYFGIKSRRLKCFIDLRMACESFLKSIHALYGDHSRDRKGVIKEVESFGHNITRIAEIVAPHLTEELWEKLQPYSLKMSELPIGLRYALDGYDFIEAREKDYYDTVGDDTWMDTFYEILCALRDEIDAELSKHSGIISVSDIPIEKIIDPGYNKYRK